MAVPKRAASIGLIVVSLALTVTGVVLAATDQYPGGSSRDPLALNGFPPKSAQVHFVISTGQQYTVSADLNVNFVTDAVEANVEIPMFFSTTILDLRLVNHHLYGTSPNLSSVIGSTWFSYPMSQPSLYGLSLEMTKPDISLISGFTQQTITHNGYSTTYSYHRDNVAINSPSGLPLTLPTRAAIDFTITVGKQGELTASSFTVTSKTSTASISATVLSYNRPAHIASPPPGEVKSIDTTQIGKLFGSPTISSLLTPRSVASLGQIRLN
jgi:hypothetical protein